MKVSALWRHPVKSHGREALERVTLTQGKSMPFDRLWAIAHDACKADGSEWAACQNFSIGSKSPALMAITASLDEVTKTITLRHPDTSDLTVQPDTQSDALLQWVRPLADPKRPQPARVFKLEDRGFTDTPFASVSLCNRASHEAVETLANASLQPERWRGNIWFDGAQAWEEFEWLGRELRLGTVRLKVEERIQRCKATMANTDTGIRDVDTLMALNMLDHQHFGIYASIIETGEVALGDQLELI
ncbi:MOSC domain-containing protein [Sulfitobacter sp. S223]|uniref:MOSC domain-containing protein n=1 Tax=Sulfitobacter sp. S223 TaxID=2867023 RepID=UPI0021A25CE5|nr:MOSC domain-containing protein [Sulfitobacter sp. S223]UWR28093.1 MOSC domain-containing protein [Sulfitobacter sp. S223]